MLHRITPLILTHNEEANIGRTLERLVWARRIVILDSGSTDATLEIASAYPQVDIIQRPFDSFAEQCNFGLERIETEWVLSIDADYVCTDALIREIAALPERPSPDGFTVRFRYCVHGKPLRGTLYPPRTVLYRKDRGRYRQDGHAHRVHLPGKADPLHGYIHHDDRKPLRQWLQAQSRYADLEVDKIRAVSTAELAFTDRLRRRSWVAPLLTPLYCLFAKGLIFDGRAGWYYTLQRTYAELLLALKLMDREIDTAEPIDSR